MWFTPIKQKYSICYAKMYVVLCILMPKSGRQTLKINEPAVKKVTRFRTLLHTTSFSQSIFQPTALLMLRRGINNRNFVVLMHPFIFFFVFLLLTGFMSVVCCADVTSWCVRTELYSMAFKSGCKCSTRKRRAGVSAAWMTLTRGHLFVLTQVAGAELWRHVA